MQSRLLRSTSFLDRDLSQIKLLKAKVADADLTNEEREAFTLMVNDMEAVLLSRTSPDGLAQDSILAVTSVADRIDQLTKNLAESGFPGAPGNEELKRALAQPGWGGVGWGGVIRAMKYRIFPTLIVAENLTL